MILLTLTTRYPASPGSHLPATCADCQRSGWVRADNLRRVAAHLSEYGSEAVIVVCGTCLLVRTRVN